MSSLSSLVHTPASSIAVIPTRYRYFSLSSFLFHSYWAPVTALHLLVAIKRKYLLNRNGLAFYGIMMLIYVLTYPSVDPLPLSSLVICIVCTGMHPMQVQSRRDHEEANRVGIEDTAHKALEIFLGNSS